jgi:hypothetical protein
LHVLIFFLLSLPNTSFISYLLVIHTSPRSVEKRDVLRRHLSALSEDELRFLVTKQLRLVSEQDPWAQDKQFLQVWGLEGSGRLYRMK